MRSKRRKVPTSTEVKKRREGSRWQRWRPGGAHSTGLGHGRMRSKRRKVPTEVKKRREGKRSVDCRSRLSCVHACVTRPVDSLVRDSSDFSLVSEAGIAKARRPGVSEQAAQQDAGDATAHARTLRPMGPRRTWYRAGECSPRSAVALPPTAARCVDQRAARPRARTCAGRLVCSLAFTDCCTPSSRAAVPGQRTQADDSALPPARRTHVFEMG
jgi:hypothetical protein